MGSEGGHHGHGHGRGGGQGSGMYRLNPAYRVPHTIELPQGMYRMSNVATPNFSGSHAMTNGGVPSGTAMFGVSSGGSSSFVPSGGEDEIIVGTTNKSTNQHESSSGKKKASPGKSPPATSSHKTAEGKLPFQQRQGRPGVVNAKREDQAIHRSELLSEERVEIIEKRQLAIISKLVNLRDLITTLHARYVEDEGTGLSLDSIGHNIDIVVNASPTRPPWSMLFFRKLIHEFYGSRSCIVRAHYHSSLMKSELHRMFEVFNTADSYASTAAEEQNTPSITITLIWKATSSGEVELLLSPLTQGTPIIGEANLCRFFSRLLPQVFPLNYDTLDVETLTHVDSLLEEAEDAHFSFNQVEGHLKLRAGNGFLLGQATIADFNMYSAVARLVLQSGLSGDKVLAKFPDTRNWCLNCQDFGGFQLI